MHRTLGLLVAALVFASPLLLLGQREEANPQRPSVQVGVPEGRGDRGGAANAARGRGRPSGPPRAVPRGADGHVLLGGATPTEKGVWLPGPVDTESAAAEGHPLPAVGQGALRRPQQQRARAAHALQAVGRGAPVPHAVRRRDGGDARAPARLHLRHRRAPHLPRGVHGRPLAPQGLHAHLLRPLDRLVGRRHAGDGHGRVQRRVLDGSRRPAAHHPAAHHREVHAHRFQLHPLRADGGRPRRLHRAVGPAR